MAIFRKVHVQFWGDIFVQSLTPEQKFFFLYLLTNEKTRQCGIYEISTRQISYDTGYNVDTVNKMIDFFTGAKKIQYSRQTNEIAIKNWDKYNGSSSPKVQNLVNKELVEVKDKDLIEYINSTDTVSIDYKTRSRVEPEEEIEPEPELEPEKPKLKKGFIFPTNDFKIELPQIEIDRAIQYLTFTKHIQASHELVMALWGAFKSKHFTGEKSYKSDKDIIRHFFETLKFEKIDGSAKNFRNTTNGNSGKLGTSDARTEALRKW